MKLLLKYLLFAAVPAAMIGCGTTETGTSSASHEEAATTGSSEEETPMIRVGMSKSQVIRAWGEPSAKQITGHGEIWVWGGQNWKRMIPYAGPFMHVQTSKALFGTDGRVKDFRLTDKGDIMSEGEGYAGGFNAW
ncbi:MAG: hypothetical protein PHC88_11890 [Terrimicrobiaceae bacterium]|nr:hypothetical protein [Terrimicrobiaceae bacterium]